MTSAPTKSKFTLAKIFLWTAMASVPFALFGQYYYWANNTVDARTQPLLESGWGLIYFVGLVGVVLALCLVPLYKLITTGRYRAATALAMTIGLALFISFPLIESRILHPPQGNSHAQLHNDAAAITAAAILSYFDRTQKWPSHWDDLQSDVEQVLGDIQNYKATLAGLRPTSGPPPASLSPLGAPAGTVNPTAAAAAKAVGFAQAAPMSEPSQSVLERPVDLSNIDFHKLQRLVDVDFEADPMHMIRQPWHMFSGIRPHKPSYNTYRIEFQMLIDRMRRSEP